MSYTFEQGKRYQARVQLRGIEALFGGASDVRAEFVKLGVSELQVADQGGDRYLVTGRWAAPTQTVELPSQVVEIIPLDAPAAPTQAAPTPGAPTPAPAAPEPAAAAPPPAPTPEAAPSTPEPSRAGYGGGIPLLPYLTLAGLWVSWAWHRQRARL